MTKTKNCDDESKKSTSQRSPIPSTRASTQITPECSFTSSQGPFDDEGSFNDKSVYPLKMPGTRLFNGDESNHPVGTQKSRDYYNQLFSSDSEESEVIDSVHYHQNGSLHQLKSQTLEIEDLSTFPIEYKDELLGFNQPIPKIMTQESSPETHTDKIATFNVQNKYDHVSAAELMFNENLTYIAFQEPFQSSNPPADSWQSFSKCELQSARLDCYQTHHQIILIDTFRWGGKILSNFESQANGRVTGIAFQFGDGAKIGIISVYASSAEIHDNITDGINKEIHIHIKRIKEGWKSKHETMNVVILGDFQETCTISNRDNVGRFRKSKIEDGILMNLEDSHESYVRKLQKDQPYITRFGGAGARGIDHILLPSCEVAQKLFPKAYICRDQGATYFPSDHSLLICEYDRNERNNNEDGIETIKYNYSNLYNIKMKNTGPAGKNISIDESQFKGSEKYRQQAALYARTQKISGDNADLSNYHLDPLEARLDLLTEDLWQAGKDQNVCGQKNKLVHIDEHQALEISYIYKKFMLGVKDIMGRLKLTEEKDALRSAGVTRGRIRQGKGFKMFHNLPIPSKLRYLRSSLKAKRRLIEKAQNWLKEISLRQTFDINSMKEADFWAIRDCIVKTHTIERHAQTIASKISAECEEREVHINHVQHMRNSKDTDGKNNLQQEVRRGFEDKTNCLPDVSSPMITLINKWLEEANCHQPFNVLTSSKWLETLTTDITNWKLPLTDFWEEDSIANNIAFRHRLQDSLELCASELKKVENKISLIQIKYRKETLAYFLKVNTIDSFTRKVLHKKRSAPTTHSIIWDDEIQSMRPCKSEIEELKATQEHHGKWMGNTKAPENCAFAEVVHEGKLGPRGIKLKGGRKLKMTDVPNLIHNGHKLSRKVKRAFIAAHNKYISKLFRNPGKNRNEFFYPFYLQDRDGKMNEETFVERKLWRSLGSTPGKARHDGFQLATIGRFGQRWRRFLCKFVKIMLIMRYIPYEMKKIARYPIPKPGKVNEYRPISLCNDLYCFLNSIITAKTSSAIEKAKLFHNGITSYRRGKSCATLVAIEQSFREDCIENNLPSVQIDEDEEKFFDRVCLEIILASMRINGFPDSGYIEFKACMMSEKIVEIITCKGTVFAKFVCGLEQGNPDSPTIANLVIKMKHDVWAMLPKSLRDIIRNDPEGNCNRYRFHVQDRDDGEVWIYMMGYCDDNSKFLSTSKEDLLIPLAHHYIQMAGDLSMITKIGRKSSKCEIQFFNISAEMTVKLQKIWSTAWSFVHDAPMEEQVPFKVYLQEEELKKFYKLCNYEELSMEEKESWDEIVHPKAHRHLGLTATIGGDTSKSSQATISKMYDRLAKLKVRHMELAAQRKSVNMLVATMHSYVPIQNGHDQDELSRLDSSIATAIMKRNGISHTDCKHRIFLPLTTGGLGFLSTLEVDVIATARELEIICNGQGLDSETFRTRIAAIPNYLHAEEEKIVNHARKAILKLARYGLYLRDSRDGVINDIMEKIATINNIHTIGNPLYKDGNSYSIGYGKARNLLCAFGSPLHLLLRHLQSNKWIPDGSEKSFKIRLPCSVEDILRIKQSVQARRFTQITSFHSFYEWRNLRRAEPHVSVEANPLAWRTINIERELQYKFPSIQRHEWDDNKMLNEEIQNISKIHWKNHVITHIETDNSIGFDTYSDNGKMLNFIEQRKSPIIIATDGAHLPKDPRQTSSSFVLCSLDIRPNESLGSGEWINRPMIPLLARTIALPHYLGAHESDIAHGEGYAFVMQELALDPNMPRIIVTDSVAIREQMINLRDDDSKEIDREYIRNKAGGISKYLISIVKEHMDGMAYSGNKYNAPTNIYDAWLQTLEQRNIEFLKLAKTWIANEEGNTESEEYNPTSSQLWNPSYLDEHTRRSIIKVDSHQLDKHGRSIKKPPRYDSLLPNLALLSANHHADVGAELGLTFSRNQEHSNQDDTSKTILHSPESNLTFYLTSDGQLIDRHVSAFIRSRFNLERIQRLQSKPTQGFLWRIIDHVTISWKTLNLHKGFLRSLLGMSNSHSRNIYKSSIYREGNLRNYLETVHDPETRQCIQCAPIKEQMKYLLNCPWCQCQSQPSSKGNRRHIILHCHNVKIAKFRNRMNNVVGSQLATLFAEMEKKTSSSEILDIIYEIEACFLNLQRKQIGRLLKMSNDRNILYIPINEIVKKMQENSVEDAIKSHPIKFFLNLFHMTPDKLMMEPGDEESGLLDSVWLGLMPSIITTVIHTNIRKISKTLGDREEGLYWKETLMQDWRRIENFNMGRAIGIHRIMNGVGTDYQAGLVAKHSLQHMSNEIAAKRRSRAKRMSNYLGRESALNPKKRRKMVTKNKPTQTINCNGITCGLEKILWCGTSNFNPNTIPIQRKQCLRCSLFTTAMKTTADIMISLQQVHPQQQVKFVQLLQEQQKKRNVNFTSLIHMLKTYITSNAQFQRAQYISKNRPTEKWKRVCKLLIELSLRKNNPIITINNVTATFQKWINEVEQTVQIKDQELLHNKAFMNKCLKEFQNEMKQSKVESEKQNGNDTKSPQSGKKPSNILSEPTLSFAGKSNPSQPLPSALVIEISSDEEQDVSQGVANQSNDGREKRAPVDIRKEPNHMDQEVILKAKINLMNRRMYTSGSILLMAIEVIRNKYKEDDVFVACPEAAQIIRTWNPNEGWIRFARIFYSAQVCHRNPNGLYIIPIFSGETTSGHWSVIAIQKVRRRRVAVVIDSLGKGSLNNPIVNLISQAFKPNRGKVKWSNPECRNQVGVECGARTICAMHTLAKAHHEKIDFEESIRKATLWFPTEYDQMDVRRDAAKIVQEYRDHMKSRAIRLRQRR